MENNLFPFTKMHGAGNDFVVIDGFDTPRDYSASLIRKLSDRHFGVGCDQVLIVERPESSENDFKYRIFNANGKEVEQCGNGARCFARFVYEKGLTDKTQLQVETAGGVIVLHINAEGIQVDMGKPVFLPEHIPFNSKTQKKQYTITIGEEDFVISAVSMGNPHCVFQVDDVHNGEFERLGALFESHPDFPERANAGFMQVIDRSHIKLRVYERGVGETLACGSGACAAVVSGIINGLLDSQVQVDLLGGTLNITWQGEGHPVVQTGPAEFVFQGSFLL
ncbi:MAG: diaminopimelate epimerase [Cellvibrionales bacterium]|nr:diaminopimelate epimerase [Cellvibrionales bacterium]